MLLLQGGFLLTTSWSMLYFLLHLVVFVQNHLAAATIARNVLSMVAVQVVASFLLDYHHRSSFLQAGSKGTSTIANKCE